MGQGQWSQEVNGVPLQAEVLTVPSLGLPLLLALRVLVPGSVGPQPERQGGEWAHRARDTCSAADGLQTGGAAPPRALSDSRNGDLKSKISQAFSVAK